MNRFSRGIASLLPLLILGCGEDTTTPNPLADLPGECENLDPTHCLMPYPTSRFLSVDDSTETGFRVDIPEAAFPLNQFEEPIATTDVWNRFDGFSPMTSIIAGFDGKIDNSNLAAASNIDASLEASSPTVLLNAATGELVAHFAEIDEWYNADPDTTTFYIRPAQRLEENQRYIVAIRDLMRDDGTSVEPSAYFRALRDDVATSNEELEARRSNMEDIFTQLDAAGVVRDGLILAWDFHTASGPSLWGETVAMRDDAFSRFESDETIGTCTVDSVDEDVNGEIWRRIRGTFVVPLYMESQYEGTLANRNANGEIEFKENSEAFFELVIPPAVRDHVLSGGDPAPMMMYGHGLLGSGRQVSSSGARAIAQRFGYVLYGTDYWGLSEPDEAQFINEVVTQFGNFGQLGERLMQGTVNSLILQKAMASGRCLEIDEVRVSPEGTPILVADPTEQYYYGISQGGIMGATLAGLSDTIDAYVLQVGAISYATMVRRSLDFDEFERVFELWYTSKLDRDWFIVSTQSMWDLAEPSTYAPHILSDPLPGTDVSSRRILYQTSQYDTEVPNVASDIAARTIGLPWLPSSVYEPWNIESTDGPSASGYVIYHLSDVEPIEPGVRIVPEDNNAHGDLRHTDEMQRQLGEFCKPDGMVIDTCSGDCAITNPRAS